MHFLLVLALCVCVCVGGVWEGGKRRVLMYLFMHTCKIMFCFFIRLTLNQGLWNMDILMVTFVMIIIVHKVCDYDKYYS